MGMPDLTKISTVDLLTECVARAGPPVMPQPAGARAPPSSHTQPTRSRLHAWQAEAAHGIGRHEEHRAHWPAWQRKGHAGATLARPLTAHQHAVSLTCPSPSPLATVHAGAHHQGQIRSLPPGDWGPVACCRCRGCAAQHLRLAISRPRSSVLATSARRDCFALLGSVPRRSARLPAARRQRLDACCERRTRHVDRRDGYGQEGQGCDGVGWAGVR